MIPPPPWHTEFREAGLQSIVLVCELACGAQVCIEVAHYASMCAALCHVAVDTVCKLLIKALELLPALRSRPRGHIHARQQHMAVCAEHATPCLEPQCLQAIIGRGQGLNKISKTVVDQHRHTLAFAPRPLDCGRVDGVLREQLAQALCSGIGARF